MPSYVLKNETSLFVLNSLFYVCLQTGRIPSFLSKSIINPITKFSSSDLRDPMSYRGISLASTITMYKMYTYILNKHIVNTIDHLSSHTCIIDTRKKNKQSTFCAFIDSKNAFDSIVRNLLWY